MYDTPIYTSPNNEVVLTSVEYKPQNLGNILRGADLRPDNNLGLMLGYNKFSQPAYFVKHTQHFCYIFYAQFIDCECFRIQTNGQILIDFDSKSTQVFNVTTQGRNEFPTELLCFEMSNQPISTTNIMQPSANVQAQDT